MKKQHENKWRGVVIAVALPFFYAVSASAQPEMPKPLYKDKNGYFASVPPDGWKQNDSQTETIRSKVSFSAPEDSRIAIFVIVGPSPSTSYTLDDAYAESKEKKNHLPPAFRGGTFDVERKKIAGYDAVSITMSKTGMIENRSLLFVTNNLSYTVTFSAPTKTSYDKYVKTSEVFVSNFQILDPKKTFTDVEIREVLEARDKAMKRLEPLMQ